MAGHICIIVEEDFYNFVLPLLDPEVWLPPDPLLVCPLEPELGLEPEPPLELPLELDCPLLGADPGLEPPLVLLPLGLPPLDEPPEPVSPPNSPDTIDPGFEPPLLPLLGCPLPPELEDPLGEPEPVKH